MCRRAMSEDLDYLTAYIIYVSMTCTLGYILSAEIEHHGHHVQRSVFVPYVTVSQSTTPHP